MRLFGDYEVNVRILQQRNIAEYSGENISNLSFILRGSEDLYQQKKRFKGATDNGNVSFYIQSL
jgi:hypothetical protein